MQIHLSDTKTDSLYIAKHYAFRTGNSYHFQLKFHTVTKLICFEKTLCHDIGNSKLHNVCKFQGKISRTFPFIVHKLGAAESRIAMQKSRNSNLRKCHFTPCEKR